MHQTALDFDSKPDKVPLSERQMQELNEFLAGIGEQKNPGKKSIWVRFWRWRCAHLNVEGRLYDLTMKAKKRGFSRYGLKAVWEVLRWHFSVEVEKTEAFKCSNSYTSRYARFLMWKYPELDGFFSKNDLRSE